jgi:hypothetical protein
LNVSASSKTELEPASEADDEGAHGQKKHQAAGHDGEE